LRDQIIGDKDKGRLRNLTSGKEVFKQGSVIRKKVEGKIKLKQEIKRKKQMSKGKERQ
jgi:hypothetical protein